MWAYYVVWGCSYVPRSLAETRILIRLTKNVRLRHTTTRYGGHFTVCSGGRCDSSVCFMGSLVPMKMSYCVQHLTTIYFEAPIYGSLQMDGVYSVVKYEITSDVLAVILYVPYNP